MGADEGRFQGFPPAERLETVWTPGLPRATGPTRTYSVTQGEGAPLFSLPGHSGRRGPRGGAAAAIDGLGWPSRVACRAAAGSGGLGLGGVTGGGSLSRVLGVQGVSPDDIVGSFGLGGIFGGMGMLCEEGGGRLRLLSIDVLRSSADRVLPEGGTWSPAFPALAPAAPITSHPTLKDEI